MSTPAIEAIGELSGRWVWLALLHGLWLGLAAAALVALVFASRRRLSHASRHTLLLAALGAIVAAPPFLATVQSVAGRPRARGGSIGTAMAVVGAPAQRRTPGRHLAGVPAIPHAEGAAPGVSVVFQTLAVRFDRVLVIVRAARPVALAAWALAVLVLAGVLALGVRGLNRLCREASAASGDVQERTRRLARLLRLGNVPAIRVHATLAEPCLCGVFRPVVLLPGRWLAAAGPELLDAVLAHELAHLRRSDHLVNLAQRVVEALLFFHPAVHWLSRTLRRQGELCADALAVRLTGDPLALARALESVARQRTGSPSVRPLGAALGGESMSLLPRIQELIGMTPLRSRPRLLWPLAALPLAAALALVAVSVGAAEDAPRPEPAPARDIPRATYGPSASGRREPPPAIADPEPQLSYEMRCIDLEARSWADRLQGRLMPPVPGSGGRVWIVDEAALIALLHQVGHDMTANVLQAPKVTVFEFGRATFLWGLDAQSADRWVAAQNIKDDSRFARQRSRIDLELHKATNDSSPLAMQRSRIDLVGAFMPEGTRLSVVLRDTTRADLRSEPKAEPPQSHPLPGEVRYEGAHDVPADSSLLISLGRFERRLRSRAVPFERLIVITPRRIDLSPKPRQSPPPSRPGPKSFGS